MLELIWRLRLPTLDDESVVLPLISAIAQTPGFSAGSYDLNQKEQWRSFELERAVVDALTQRTQLMRIRGDESGVMAMIAFGKREEQPTAIIRLPDPPKLTGLVSRWPELYEDLPVESTVISDATWRHALQSAGLATEVRGGLLGMVFGWRRGAEPRDLAEIVGHDSVVNTPIRLDRESNHLVLWLSETPEISSDAHQKGLEHVARRLIRSS
jgi:hypothetical protein